MYSVRDHPKVGFPHSEIFGSKPVRGSPKLIAAYHVLLRLLAPRHPPNALLALDQLLHLSKNHRSRDLDSPSRAGVIPRPRNSILTREVVPPGSSRRPTPTSTSRLMLPLNDVTEQRTRRTTSRLEPRTLYGNCFHQNLVEVSTSGGGERDRTDDLLLAKQALSQLSYTPLSVGPSVRTRSPALRISGGPGRI